MTEIIIRKDEPTPVIKMITPGRRAIGESWSEVTIGHDGNHITVDTKPHEAPADGKPIIVPTAGREKSPAMMDFILDKYLGLADERARRPAQGMSREEKHKLINEWWHAFVEQKLKHLRGQSQFGPGGFTQRQRVAQDPETRPKYDRSR